MPRSHAFVAAILLVAALVPVARAADPALLPGESRTTAARLVEAGKKIDDKKYTEAIDDLQAILETAGNDLVPLTPEHCVQARLLCHRELARLPAEALRDYRARVEPQAKKWLDEATPARDTRLLRRLVDEAFCTRAGETAIDLLGDLAFERGRFDEAGMWWRLLAPPLDAKKEKRAFAPLVYPDVQGDKARLYAKQIVARIFAGALEEAAQELKAFHRDYPNAEGALAGRKGKYADLLQDLLKNPPPELDKTWTTYGGDATRGLVLPAPPGWLERLSQTVKEGPTWRFDLAARKPLDESPPPPGTGLSPSMRARALAFAPLISGHYAIVSDARYVTLYDLRTGERVYDRSGGKKEEWFDLAEEVGAMAPPNLKLPTEKTDLRYTMTVAGDCLYVRLGAQAIFLPDEKEVDRDKKTASFLACLSLDPATPRDKRVRWCTRPVVFPNRPVLAQSDAIFEGAPVVHNGLLYAAVTWFEGDHTVTAIQCFPAGTETLPPKRWQQIVCETHELKPKEERSRQHLLTVAGPNVVYCSHSGAIVAVDALTGKTAWAVRYPSQPATNADQPSLRDLTPCVYAANRLYAAPADYDHLLCLDPLTGEILWDREHIAATHLLGVGKGRLIFTMLTGLRAVNAADGSDSGGWFLRGSGGSMVPMGRGFLIGDVAVWPTVTARDGDRVFVIRQEDGNPPSSRIDKKNDFINELQRVPIGNLVYHNGVLAVADATTLSVFVPPEQQGEQRPQTREPAPAENRPLAVAHQTTETPAPRVDATRNWLLPWERSQEVTLAPGTRLVPISGLDDGLLVSAESGKITFLPHDAARKGWDRYLNFQPITGWFDGERLILAGSDGLVALHTRDREQRWTIERRGCGSFQFAGGRVFFLEHGDRLFAVDAATGSTLWTKWAIGARLHQEPPLGHFHPRLTPLGMALLVQPTPGQLWLLDAATGNRIHEETNRFEPWPRSPVAINDHTAAVVLDARTVALIDGTTGKTVWKHTNADMTTATGEAPQLVVDRENIVLVTANNLGYTLQRLDRATGKPLWDKPPLLSLAPASVTTGWSLDNEALYCTQDQALTARSLADGKILWRRVLPEANGVWQTWRLGDAVLAYPTAIGGQQFQFRWQGFSVQWDMDHSREVGVGPGLPVMCCDALSGRLRQRLNLCAGAPRVRTRIGFVSRLAGSSRLDAAPQVVRTRSDLLIAIDSRVWRFTPTLANDR